MLMSGGVLVKAVDQVAWSGTPATWGTGAYWEQNLLAGYSYGEIYVRQLWVATLVNKRAKAVARLPLKTYQRGSDSRSDASSSAYGQLLAAPNRMQDPFFFWLWTASTRDVYGEAFWGKVRDRDGRPVELVLLHPSSVHSEIREGKVVWSYDDGRLRLEDIPRRDLVHFKAYNPHSTLRGLSPLEPLRATLENEEGARRANSALWKHGGRPSVYLSHPKTLSEPAANRLAENWTAVHSGVDNWAKTLLLEEGLVPSFVPLNVEELQYIEARKVNREEACAIYDVPPPVVHILDRATFSNITEQMRSMYRDTMAPFLKEFESTLEFELRDGRMGDSSRQPDFGPAFYAEFLMDEVLRGDFEERVNAYQAGINAGWLMPSEVREMENRPFVPGSDQLLVNSTLIAVEPQSDENFDKSDFDRVNALGQLVRAGFDPEASVAAVGLPPIEHSGLPPVTVQPDADGVAPAVAERSVRTVMGRLSRVTDKAAVDLPTLTAGLNGDTATVVALFDDCADLGEFKSRLKAAAVKE